MDVRVRSRDDGETMPESLLKRASPCPDPLSGRVLVTLAAGFLLVSFVQSWGLIEDDTKLPLVMTPLPFMEAATHLWTQSLYGGSAATLSAGYLFPMGPFFALTQLLHVPTWCAERIWLAVLLTVGCWGVVRLAEALGIGNRWGRVLAGLAYCAAPIAITWVPATADLLAVVLLPWIVQPLVVGSREGSPRRAAARSGVAIALMGGVNATFVVAVMPVAAIWLLTRQPGPRRRQLMGWWVIVVVLACFWWIVPTVFDGSYGFNYLPYTETSTLTTSTTSVFESLRGAANWIDYFRLNDPLLRGPWILVSESTVIVGTAVVTALGLAGLCRRIPERLFLISTLSFGVVVIAAGYSGPLGGPFSHGIQQALEGGLAPFRNVSKFSPDVMLPLALGLAWMVSAPNWSRAAIRISSRFPSVSVFLAAVAVVAVAALIIAGTPFWRGDLYGEGGFKSIPRYWTQAGQWLNRHQGHDNALLVPGASFGYYSWGDPTDEPLALTSNTSIEQRNIIPLASAGYIQMLDATEKAIDDGTVTPGLAEYLSRGGVKYVVERNDLNLSLTGAPPPAQVHQVLSETQGLTEVASFGSYLPARQVKVGSLSLYDAVADVHLRPVEIFRVDPPGSIVQTYPASNPLVVSGDPGSLLPLSGARIAIGRASVLSGDPKAGRSALAPGATWIITDGNPRVDESFGLVSYNESYLLSPGQRVGGRLNNIPHAYVVVPGAKHETVEDPAGAASVAASTYGSSDLIDAPAKGPISAFDGNPKSAWVANAQGRSVNQWVSISFSHPRALSTILVTPLVGSQQQPTVKWITISTDRGSVRRYLPAKDSPVPLSVPRGTSRFLRITIDATRVAKGPSRGGFPLGAGITEVAIPGVTVHARMKVPDDERATFSARQRHTPVIVFNRPVVNENLALGLAATDDSNMARIFTVPKAMNANVSGYLVPLNGTSLEHLLQEVAPQPLGSLTATASSWLGSLPRYRAENMVDDASSPWIAEVGDKHPSIDLTWQGTFRVASITLDLASQASRPTAISITSPNGTRHDLPVPKNGGRISFAPLMTNTLRVTFVHIASRRTFSSAAVNTFEVPVGLSRVTSRLSTPHRSCDESE